MYESRTPVVPIDAGGICSCALQCAYWKPPVLTADRLDQHRLRTLRRLGIELGEGVYHSGGAELPHSPGLAGALVCRSCLKEVVVRTGVGAGDHAPTGAVPLFDEGLRGVAGGVEECSHGPDVGGGDDGHPPEIIGSPRARAGDDAPAGAVPVLDQRPRDILGII